MGFAFSRHSSLVGVARRSARSEENPRWHPQERHPAQKRRGIFRKPRGTFAKSHGIFAKSCGTFAKSCGTFARSHGIFAKSCGTFAKSHGTFRKSCGTHATPRGTFGRSRGTRARCRGTPAATGGLQRRLRRKGDTPSKHRPAFAQTGRRGVATGEARAWGSRAQPVEGINLAGLPRRGRGA